MMDERFAAGTAYQTALPFDLVRGDCIRATTVALCANARAPIGVANDNRLLLDPLVHTLDVGSGQGGIASFWPHSNIVGLEISDVAVRLAREAFGHKGVKYVCGAIEEFELGAGEKPFDLVVAQESIEHWTNTSLGLRHIHAAMAKDGALVLTTPNRDSLHCRISRKLGMGEPPMCSSDHIHEFGFLELIEHVCEHGFKLEASLGVGLLPYWTMEDEFGFRIRRLTDADEQVVKWFADMGQCVPPEFAFIQCHRFRRTGPYVGSSSK